MWGDPTHGVWVDKKAFKDFWSKSAREIEDFGEFIRENIEDWVKQYKAKDKPAEGCGPTTKLDPEETKPQ
ncbi:hypothetical protein D3C83_292270 [compost metagenome]